MNLRSLGTLMLMSLSLCALLPACALKAVKPMTQAGPRERLFPLGVYKHDVSLVIAPTATTQQIDFNFNGVVRIKRDAVQMVALSHFGTTVFKLNDDLRTGEVKTEVYVDQMKKFESRIPEYYAILRPLLLASYPKEPKGSTFHWMKTDANGLPLEAETVGLEKNAVFHFLKYDANKIPVAITINHPAYTVTVKVSDYEI